MRDTESLSCDVDEVGGLPVFTGRRPGRAEAALVFRTGFVDETVPRCGLTHLIEHLAAGPIAPSDGVRARVSQTTTSFTVEGEDEFVMKCLDGIASRLVALPIERVATECRVLDVEEQNDNFSSTHFQLLSHYGYQGPGLAGCRQFGLRQLNVAELQDRAARCFGTANAALALSRPVQGFNGLQLHDGRRQKTPHATPLRRAQRAAESSAEGGQVSMGAPVADSSATMVLALVIERRGWQRLRHELALVYDLHCSITRVGLAERFLTVTCDALPRDAHRAADELLELLTNLASAPVDAEDLSVGIADFERRMRNGGFASVVGAAASALILDQPRLPVDFLGRVSEVTAADVHQAAASLHARLLVGLPAGHSLGLPVLRRDDGPEPAGQEHRRVRRYAPDAELVVGDEGVSVLDGDTLSTVRFDRCAAAIREPGEALVLLGINGTEVRVDPVDATDRASVLQSVENALEPGLIVPEDDLAAPSSGPDHDRHLVFEPTRGARVSPRLLEQLRRDGNTSSSTLGLPTEPTEQPESRQWP